MVTPLNAEKYLKNSTDVSIRNFWHKVSVDSFHMELFLLPAPENVPEPISTFIRYLSGISRKILHHSRTAGQLKQTFESHIKTVAANEIRRRDWNVDKTPAASRLVSGVPQRSLISIIIFLKLLSIQILVMSLWTVACAACSSHVVYGTDSSFRRQDNSFSGCYTICLSLNQTNL